MPLSACYALSAEIPDRDISYLDMFYCFSDCLL
jgi:hypothetical protein